MTMIIKQILAREVLCMGLRAQIIALETRRNLPAG
jgi:hypothetical protein